MMKEVTVKIPEKQLNFVLELFKNLGLEARLDAEIPESQKEEVRSRMRDSVSEDLVPWDEAKKVLTQKKKG